MRHWKSRLAAFMVGFGIGLLIVLLVGFVASLFAPRLPRVAQSMLTGRNLCRGAEAFARPEDVLAALKSEDVIVRREAFQRLFLRPGVKTIYYDYERDKDYPERAERAELKYVNLDGGADDEALITFVRYENPVALILKRNACGWSLAAAISSWLRFEDYPYLNWLELLQATQPAEQLILVRESGGDRSQYARNVRLLKLTDGALTEIAEFAEESIKLLENYRGADWSDVKLREDARFQFLEGADGHMRLRIETTEEMVKYSGAQESYNYWLETDGAWHTSQKHWRERTATRLKLISTRTREIIWNEQSGRFEE